MARRPRTGGRRLRPLFVASLGHSGSTLLDLLLGAHSRLVALGEITAVFRRLEQPGFEPSTHRCSCGEVLAACPFWGRLLDGVAGAEHDEERYELVLEAVRADYGTEVAAVDASKNLPALRNLRAAAGEVLVVSLVRDVRGWTTAYRDRARRRGELAWPDLVRRHGARALGVRSRPTPTALFRLWYERNCELDAGIADLGCAHVSVGYEELVGDPEGTMRRVLAEAGLDYEASVLDPASRGDHLAFGNRMAFGSARAAITYDGSWRDDPSWRRAARRRPRVLAYSDDRAYGGAAPA